MGTNGNYNEIKQYLLDNYGSIESCYMAHNRFVVASQNNIESSKSFGLRLRSLARKAFPNASQGVLEQVLCNHFIRGCAGAPVRRYLFLAKLSKFEDIVEAAHSIERTLKEENETLESTCYAISTLKENADDKLVEEVDLCRVSGKSKPRFSERYPSEKLLDAVERLTTRIEQLEIRVGSKSSNKKPVTCYKCKKPGHITRNCYVDRVNYCLFLSRVDNDLIKVDVHVNGIKEVGLIDTGLQKCFMRLPLAKKYGFNL